MAVFYFLNIILIVLLVILALAAMWGIYRKRRKMSIAALKEGVGHVKKRLPVIALLTLLSLGVYCGVHYVNSLNYPRLSIVLNYEEAAKGQNPNKTRFNASEIISPEILEEVIARGGYDVTAEELRESLVLKSVFDDQEIDTESEYDIATEYQVAFEPNLITYGIDGTELMELLGEAYENSFLEKYSENDSILQLTFEDLDNWDYMDTDDYLGVKAQELQRYITNYGNENPNYRDSVTGETFASLSQKISNFDIDLERFSSFVLQNGLSKDSEAYKTRLDYQNRLLDTDHQKRLAAYDIRLEAIDMYDEQMARIVLVPTNDETQEFYMSRTKIGVDYFADEADAALKQATELKEEMDHNTYAMNQMENSTAESEVYAQADAMVNSLVEELGTLSDQAKQLSDSYIQAKRDGYIRVENEVLSWPAQTGIIGGVIYAGATALILCLFFCISRIGRKKRIGGSL